jgi:DNA replication protein DnaC
MKQIETQLNQLRLTGMSQRWAILSETRKTTELSLTEGLEILLQAEIEERKNKRFVRLQKNAKFRYQAAIEELIYDSKRGLNKDMMTDLLSCEFITKGQSVLITGSTGCGKSYIASALGNYACAKSYSVAYYNTQKLLMQLKINRMDGSFLKFFDKIAKTSLLILDDFGLTRLEQQQQLDLMEIIEDRHGRTSTIIASQLPVNNWFDMIGDATIADAILDRLVHTSYRIELKGDSLRKKN